MRSHVYNRVDVRLCSGSASSRQVQLATYEGHARKVPEDNHEAPLLIVDIPSLGNALFALGAKGVSDQHS